MIETNYEISFGNLVNGFWLRHKGYKKRPNRGWSGGISLGGADLPRMGAGWLFTDNGGKRHRLPARIEDETLAEIVKTTHYDAKDNVFPRKQQPENKIDACLDLLMALSRALVGSAAKVMANIRLL